MRSYLFIYALSVALSPLISPVLGIPRHRFARGDVLLSYTSTASSSYASATIASGGYTGSSSTSQSDSSVSYSTEGEGTAGPVPAGPVPGNPLPPVAPPVVLAVASNSTSISSNGPQTSTGSPSPSSSDAPAPSNPSPASSVLSTNSSASPPSNATSTPSAGPASAGFLRGVNIGGWLVLEEWMDGDVFAGSSAVDQWTFDSTPGALAKLQNHWDTFFTEQDLGQLKDAGINAIRIPIGFWAYDNDNTPYLKGADAYLDRAIGWARTAGVKVWIDCHGMPGSQNGFDNSGHAGDVEWQQAANLQRSISVLKIVAQKYGSMSYADTVIGLELVNEPISWGNNNFQTTKQWATEAYPAVTAVTANPNLMIVMHDAFEGATAWTDVPATLNSGRRFGVDSHLYQCFVASDLALTQAQHIQEACGWASTLSKANPVMPTFVGEWSPATNICVNPDGSTTAGTSCSVAGCQCQTADYTTWNAQMVEQVRRYVEAQMDVFESSTSGYFMWAFKGPGAWGFMNGIQKGFIPNPVTSRQYPKQC